MTHQKIHLHSLLNRFRYKWFHFISPSARFLGVVFLWWLPFQNSHPTFSSCIFLPTRCSTHPGKCFGFFPLKTTQAQSKYYSKMPRKLASYTPQNAPACLPHCSLVLWSLCSPNISLQEKQITVEGYNRWKGGAHIVPLCLQGPDRYWPRTSAGRGWWPRGGPGRRPRGTQGFARGESSGDGTSGGTSCKGKALLDHFMDQTHQLPPQLVQVPPHGSSQLRRRPSPIKIPSPAPSFCPCWAYTAT